MSLRPAACAVGVVLGLLCAYLTATVSVSGPAAAAGPVTVTVTVQGKGTVTAPPGISCTEAGGSGCSGTYTVTQECDPQLKPPCHDVPVEVTLTAAPDRNGFTFIQFTGCDVATGRTCEMTVAASRNVTAVFADTTPPTVTLTAPAQNAWVGGVAQVAATASDTAGTISKVEFQVNGITLLTDTSAPYGGPVSMSGNGTATITARAYDGSSLVSTPSSRTVQVDSTAPTLTIPTGPQGLVGPGSLIWTLSAADAGSGLATVQCSVVPIGQPAAFGPCSGGTVSHTVSGLPDGGYQFSVQATDVVGNLQSVTRQFTIDATAPVVSFTTRPKSTVKTTRKSAKVSFSFGSETGASFRCSLDGAAYVACPAALTLKVKVGKHTLSVVAVDAAGNVSAPATAAWKVKRVRKHR
jgi:Bacterial Ig domain